jgi:disulfide oxidoreductase YuzD
MNFGFPTSRLRGFHAPVRRFAAGTAAAALLLLALPSPAAAAPTPTVTITDVTVTEGTGGTLDANFTIQAAPAPKPCCALQVSWATASGSATAPADFTASSGIVSLTKTGASKVVSVPVAGDAVDEPNETFAVNLTNLVGTPGRIGDAQGVATIADDDPIPLLSVNDVTVSEGNAGTATATFIASLSAASGRSVTLDWTTSAGSATAGTDYVAASGSRTIAAGSTTATIGITVKGDVLDEADESFGITLANPVNATIADGSGLATITDDDQPPLLWVNDVTITEGNAGTATATFDVTLSAASSYPVTLDWTTSAGSATAGTDYVAVSGSPTIAAGSTGAMIGVTVNGDVLDEADEFFGITLSNAVNATIADGSGVATIADDDPIPLLSVNDVTVTEGNAGTTTATFDVTLSSPSGQTVTVGWATGDDGATQPSDYAAVSGTLTFVAGDTSETIPVTVNGDITAELDEAFRFILSAPSNADLGDAEAVGTIVDDELQPVIDIDEPTIGEGQSGTAPVSFTVTLSHPAAWPVTVDWDTAAGTAGGGADYLDANGTVTFAPLDVSETVDVTVNGDGTFERDETFALDLSNATGAPIGDARGVATITNDDAQPIVSVTDVSVIEGNAGTSLLEFAVSLTVASGVDASFDFASADATATGGPDYVAAAGTLTIPAGETTGEVDVVVKGDLSYETNETLSLTLSDPADAVIGDGAAQGTILNDDKAPTAVTLRTVKKPRALVATGILESTTSGHRVTATLFRKQSGRFVKIRAKTVGVRSFRDRDGDGKTDGSYAATFLRPRAGGRYKVVVRFKGAGTYKPCGRTRVFKLPPA